MNIFITRPLIATRFVALVTLFSLVLSALPASFFVAFAEGDDTTATASDSTTAAPASTENPDEIVKKEESTQAPLEIKEESAEASLMTKIVEILPETLGSLLIARPILQSTDVNTIVVRPSDLNGWVTAGTGGGTVSFVVNSIDSVLGAGNLKLISDSDNNARANVSKSTNVPLKDLKGLSYKTKQNTANVTAGDASYRISFDADGDISTTNDTATLIHEPYWQNAGSPDDFPVVNGVWQTWNVDSGLFWASIPSSNQATLSLLTNGAGGPPLYSLAEVLSKYPAAKVYAFSIGIGSYNPLYDIDVDEVVFGIETPELLTKTTYDFEPNKSVPIPECDLGAETVADTTFDTFNLGNVNAQNAWKSTGTFDQEVVTNIYGYTTFGCKSLRISNAITSGSFGDQTFAAPLTNSVGETVATDGGFPVGTRFNRFEAQFDIASTKQTEQTGLRMTMSPDRGDGSRMSFLAFEDKATGIDVVFNEVQGTSHPVSFVPTTIATIDRSAPHTIKMVIVTNEGASNDKVEVYIDGILKHTGTSWENYYRFSTEAAAEQTPRLIKTILFRSSATAAPATDGEGFLFDNMSLKAMNDEPQTANQAKVYIYKYLQTGQGIAQIPDNSTAPNFPMISSWDATNFPSSNGTYVLGNYQGGTTLRYAAVTDVLNTPADYSTSEVTGGNSIVLPADAKCVEGKYRLVGYKLGQSLEGAEESQLTQVPPVYLDITTDQYVIVVNEKCGDATPVCAIGTNLIQNGSFEVETVNDHGGQWEIFSTVAGWLVSLSDGLEIWKNFNGTGAGLASDGQQNAELDGNNATNISQTLTTVPGATYQLKFDYSARAGTNVTDSKMDTLINGVSAMVLNTDGSAATGNYWEPQATTFVATGTSTKIAFEDIGTPNVDGGYGPLLDNVSLCMVKEAPVCTLTIKSDAADYVVEKNAAAKVLSFIHSSWVTAIGTSSAAWIWGDNPVVDPVSSTTQTFKKGFNWTGGAVTSATLKLASDNSHAVTLGSFTGGNAGEFNYGAVSTYNVASGIVAGANSLAIAVENFPMSGGTTASNPAGLMYELTITGTGESCGSVVPEVPKTTSTVKMCKFDAEQKPLSGWQLSLLGDKVKTLSVVPDGSTQSMAAVPVGNYVLKASGAYGYGNGGRSSDARFSDRDGVSPWVNTNTFAPAVVNYLSLQVNNDGAAAWGSMYSPAHVYYGSLSQLSAGNVNFQILDDQYGDNTGSINVDLYKGRTGVTGQDGCVTFTDVSFGTYQVEELMQEGWTNQSGLGNVVVDKEVVTHNVVNIKTITPPEKTSGPVTMCKLDTNQNQLAGWTLTLTGAESVANVVVPANSSAGVNTTAALSAGTSYVAFANGSWTNMNGQNPVDAEYSTTDNWVTQMDGYTGYQNDILELQINNTFDPNSNWGAYNSGHNYAQSFVPVATGTANFRIFDGVGVTPDESWYTDNTGSLNVAIYKGFAGITQANGCVTFSDVPYGEYAASEIMQDGWKEVSGDEMVTVSSSTNTFTIVNEKVTNGGGGDDTNVIDGFKWNDLDADGIWDKAEPAITGWGISLYKQETLVATTSTDELGHYSFEVTPGDYYVVEENRDNWSQTGLYQNTPNTTEDETPNSCYFTISDEESEGYRCDFGNHYTNPNPDITQCEIGKNLLTNGSFEDPLVTDTANYQIFAVVPGWGMSLPSGLEIWNSALFGAASQGNQLAELDVNAPTTISQTITTVIGDEYTVSFDFSARPGTGPTNNAVNVYVKGTFVGQSSADGTFATSTAWTSHSFTFIASTTSTEVAFEDAGVANTEGTLIDNTKVCRTKLNTPNDGNNGGNGGNGGGTKTKKTPKGEVLGASSSTPNSGEVLGAQVTMLPTGAPNAGAGGTAANWPVFLLLISIAGLALSLVRTGNVEIKKS